MGGTEPRERALRGVVLEKSRFVENHAFGIAFDIANEDCTVRQKRKPVFVGR